MQLDWWHWGQCWDGLLRTSFRVFGRRYLGVLRFGCMWSLIRHLDGRLSQLGGVPLPSTSKAERYRRASELGVQGMVEVGSKHGWSRCWIDACTVDDNRA
jgi:hypothetical protein